MITSWHYPPLVVRAIAKFKFCQQVTKRGQKNFFLVEHQKKLMAVTIPWLSVGYRLRGETVYVNILVTVSCSLNISVVYFCN